MREHVLDLMVHFSMAEMNGTVIDEQSQVSFILKSHPKSFLQFCSNVVMNKIQYNLTTLLKELLTYQSLIKGKGQVEGEANMIGQSKRFQKSYGAMSVASSSESKMIQKKKK